MVRLLSLSAALLLITAPACGQDSDGVKLLKERIKLLEFQVKGVLSPEKK
jgi:hypothetical protein